MYKNQSVRPGPQENKHVFTVVVPDSVTEGCDSTVVYLLVTFQSPVSPPVGPDVLVLNVCDTLKHSQLKCIVTKL